MEVMDLQVEIRPHPAVRDSFRVHSLTLYQTKGHTPLGFTTNYSK